MPLTQENRWAAHPRRALAIKVAVYVLPAAACWLSSIYASQWLQRSYPSMPWLVAAVLSLPPAIVVLVLGQRLMRRLLPLSLLLKLSLLFPDQVPNRLGIALRAASPKRLARRTQSLDPDEASVATRVLTLVTTLNAHDRRTRGHSERVRAVTMLVADELEIVGEERDKLEWASLLHDLGKIEVPPEILNKPGRPSADEWNILRGHPAAGPALAGSLRPWLGDWIHAMDQHHERYDGSGYPAGLAGDSIARSGRIVAVADAFEVMTAARSYKKPMSTEAAREELVACAGTHFDPTVVRSFMRVAVSDLHRALGPTSWLLSLPFSQQVGQTIHLGSAISGGSVPPALVGAMAFTLLATPTANDAGDDHADQHAAVAEIDAGETDEIAAPREPPPSTDDRAGAEDAPDDTTPPASVPPAESSAPAAPPTTAPSPSSSVPPPSVPPQSGPPSSVPPPTTTTSPPPTTTTTTSPPPTTSSPPTSTVPPGAPLGGILAGTLDAVAEVIDDTTDAVDEILSGLPSLFGRR